MFWHFLSIYTKKDPCGYVGSDAYTDEKHNFFQAIEPYGLALQLFGGGVYHKHPSTDYHNTLHWMSVNKTAFNPVHRMNDKEKKNPLLALYYIDL